MSNTAATRLRSAWSALIVAYPDDEKIARAVLGEEVFGALHPLMLKEIESLKDGIVGLERAVQPLRDPDKARMKGLLQAAQMPADPEIEQVLRDLSEEHRKIIQHEVEQPNEAPTGGSTT
jgi:hypothetical protein